MPPARTRTNHTITQHTRESVINNVIFQGKSLASTAKTFRIPESTCRAIVNVYVNTGRMDKLPRGGNRHGVILPNHQEWLTARLDTNRSMSIQDLTNQLNEHFQLQPAISRTTVQRFVKSRIGYTLKLIRKEP
ncbi:hypothetical protein BGZ73_000993, partial [Actinomortierella ambigua]